MENGEIFMPERRSMRPKNIRILGGTVLLGVMCFLGMGWCPLNRYISPPAMTLYEAENAVSAWLIDEESNQLSLSSPADFFIRMVFYEKPENVNRWMKMLARPNVSTTNGADEKWYFEFVISKAQGVSHMCSVGTNKTVTLEWSRY